MIAFFQIKVAELGKELQNDRRHSSVYSDNDESRLTPRRGSHDATLATTIYVQTRNSPAAQDMLDISAPVSPSKHDFNATTTKTDVKDMKHPSMERKVSLQSPYQISDTSATYKHGNKSEEFSIVKTTPMSFSGVKKLQTMSVYGPDVLARATATPSKNSVRTNVTSSGSDEERSSNFYPDLRSSRSQSKLRSLQFWKKKSTRNDESESEQVS